ncbi:hypothetical protein CYMTET_20673 [Cymbomonas tetramitiformis]|uniref:Uncharacterized protein n=1 Tax=Cymbomonas tetramitiformis TaxID=36881 RepID=A0AAE0G3K1_9CHLO|nr:hypothetical protein CYMTET_20673 [Cymbomonas tetramitiformis]
MSPHTGAGQFTAQPGAVFDAGLMMTPQQIQQQQNFQQQQFFHQQQLQQHLAQQPQQQQLQQLQQQLGQQLHWTFQPHQLPGQERRGSRRYRSSSDSSEGRSRGRRRLKKKKKSKKSKKQRKATAEEKGKAVATEESHPLTPTMAVKTLLQDKALRDQAFECLPAERQLAIASAKAAGEEVSWEQEGWEAMMSAQRSALQERDAPHLLPGCPPSPEESDLVWYEYTKVLHPTLSAEDEWQLAVLNRSGAKGTNTAQPSGTEGGRRVQHPQGNSCAWRQQRTRLQQRTS